MKNLTSLLIFVIGLCGAQIALAQNVDILQIESKMEERLTRLVRMSDPQGQVIVKAVLKKGKSGLPGVASQPVDIFMPGRFSKVDIQDISEFQIVILSSLEEMPPWLNDEINHAVDFEGVKKKVTFKKEDLFHSESPVERVSSEWKTEFESFSKQGFWSFVGIGILIASGLFLICWSVWSSVRGSSRDLVQGLRSIFESWSGSGQGMSAHKRVDEQSAERQQKPSGDTGASLDKNEFADYSEHALAALIGDCYWSELDNYAAWIWGQLSETQRRSVIQALPFGFAYAKYIYELAPESSAFHRHPIYLQETKCYLLSNADIRRVLTKSPNAWSSLSEIRQMSMQMSLKERLEIETKSKVALKSATAKSFNWSEVSASAQRELPSGLGNIQLTAQDEEYLFQNSKAIPASQRASLTSWVWLALLPDTEIAQILQPYAAEDLARAWVGPEVVLKKMAKALPENKLKMVEGYLAQIQPNRNSWIISEVTQKALAFESSKGVLKNAA